MAEEFFSNLAVTKVLCENLLTEDEVRLYGTCTAAYHGNKMHRDRLMRFQDYIHGYDATPALPKRNSQGSHAETQVDQNAPPTLRLSMEAIAVHNLRMGNNERKWQHMPGETVEQKWDYYIHRKPPHNPYNDPIFSSNWATSSKDRENPQGSM